MRKLRRYFGGKLETKYHPSVRDIARVLQKVDGWKPPEPTYDTDRSTTRYGADLRSNENQKSVDLEDTDRGTRLSASFPDTYYRRTIYVWKHDRIEHTVNSKVGTSTYGGLTLDNILTLDDIIRLFTLYFKGDTLWMTDYKWEPPIAPAAPPPQLVSSDSLPLARSSKTDGVVYLLRVGEWYKIGKTRNPSSRRRQLEIQLPEKAELVHQINTDDIQMLERHWHRHFNDKRGNGEWFRLADEDVREFTAFGSVQTTRGDNPEMDHQPRKSTSGSRS
jgi:hypothetical protein